MSELIASTRRAIEGRAWRHGLLVLVAVIVVALGSARTVSAHAELVSTSPTAGSVVQTVPSQVLLRFTEEIDALPDSIRVLAGDGSEVPVGEIRRDLGADTVAADLPTDLADGTYVVAWRAISGDSHPVGGAFTFSVGAPSTVDPGIVDRALDDGEPQQVSELWLGAGRWASYLGIAVVVGATAVLGVCFPAGLRSRTARVCCCWSAPVRRSWVPRS